MSRQLFGIFTTTDISAVGMSVGTTTPVFTNLFAMTTFEARKYCVEYARAQLVDTDTDPSTDSSTDILWYGQTPTFKGTSTTRLVYSLPGPDQTHISIVKFTKSGGWVRSETITSKILLTIFYQPIHRVPETGNSMRTSEASSSSAISTASISSTNPSPSSISISSPSPNPNPSLRRSVRSILSEINKIPDTASSHPSRSILDEIQYFCDHRSEI